MGEEGRMEEGGERERERRRTKEKGERERREEHNIHV